MTITVGFGAPITSAAYPGAIVSPGGNTITFPVETLESNPTHFSLILDTTDVPSGASVVSHVTYADSQGNSPDLSSLMAVSSALECDEGAAGTAVAGEDAVAAAAGSTAGEDVAVIVSFSRRIQEEKEEEEFDCSTCEDLTDAQVQALAGYDNGGKQIVCDPTCLDGVSDPTHCNCELCIKTARTVSWLHHSSTPVVMMRFGRNCVGPRCCVCPLKPCILSAPTVVYHCSGESARRNQWPLPNQELR